VSVARYGKVGPFLSAPQPPSPSANIPEMYNTGYNPHHLSVTGKELVKLLKAEGWALARMEGSHHILVRGTKTISVPVHGKKRPEERDIGSTP